MKRIILSTLAVLSLVTPARAEEFYAKIQDDTIKVFEKFNSDISTGSLGSTKIELAKNQLYFLNGAYLYCTLKNGTCAYMLDTILETDILNSKIDNKPSCPHMLRFWQEWIDNNFEKRVDYQLGTGFITKYQDFKRNIRPQYLRCSGTVATKLKGDLSLKEFIKERYTPTNDVGIAAKRTFAYLQALREQVPDVFLAAGAYKEAVKASPTPR
jgi:hypothetical protein